MSDSRLQVELSKNALVMIPAQIFSFSETLVELDVSFNRCACRHEKKKKKTPCDTRSNSRRRGWHICGRVINSFLLLPTLILSPGFPSFFGLSGGGFFVPLFGVLSVRPHVSMFWLFQRWRWVAGLTVNFRGFRFQASGRA